MKPIISIFSGHDSSFTVYDPKKDQFYVLELERFDTDKHYRCWEKSYDQNREIFNKALKHLKIQYGIENDFSMMLLKKTDLKGAWVSSVCEDKIKADSYHYIDTPHHVSHTWAAYIQSPFKKSLNIAWDGGGDDCSFMITGIDNYKVVEIEPRKYKFGMVYNIMGTACRSISPKTSLVDVAGKLMGLSAYGKQTHRTEAILKFLDDLCEFDVNDTAPPKDNYFSLKIYNQMQKDFPDIKSWYLDYKKGLPRSVEGFSEEVEKEVSYAAQKFMETRLLQIVESLLPKIEKQYNNNLTLSGGCALNVLANQEVRKKFPHLNVYVPPNPHDGGLSLGSMVDFLSKEYRFKFKKYSLAYGGLRLLDEFKIPELIQERNATEIQIKDMVSLLKDGKIIGLCQGTSEVGPRALGNRSILCDPSISNMKDVLNKKVKFREWYRPFAPITRLEDAPKYFDSPTFENMDTMAFVADVKPEYREKLPSITHVDGTARLQTVTKNSNALIYELLTEFDGVLLNTSFNVQGQPILNRATDALYILDNTGLDNVVIEYKGRLYLF
jgi:carbamoyltransferase